MDRQYLIWIVLFLIGVFGWDGCLYAQGGEVQKIQIEKRYTLYFKLNQSVVDLSFKDNELTIDEMVEDINGILRKEGSVPHNLHIIASASPEGPTSTNRLLASKRAEQVKKLLIKLFPQYKNEKIVVEYVLNDWDGVILDITRHREDIKHSAELLGILKSPAYTSAQKDSLIRSMPEAFEDIRYSLMDNKRTASITFTILDFDRVHNVVPAMEHTSFVGQVQQKDSKPKVVFRDVIDEAPLGKERRSLCLRLKTNTLGWALGHFNIAAEVDLAKHWSVAVPFYYSGGFNYFKETIKFRGIVIQPEARYYLQDNDGLYFGVHAGLGWYNFAIDGDYRIQDHKGRRPAYGGGLGFGYTYNFKRNSNWGMEFAIGAGVYDAVYDKFYNEPNGHYAERAVRKTFVGIDNASVSFIYRLGNKLKERKEGRK